MKNDWWPFQEKYGWNTDRDLPVFIVMVVITFAFVGALFYLVCGCAP